jgi:hypothetical protein
LCTFATFFFSQCTSPIREQKNMLFCIITIMTSCFPNIFICCVWKTDQCSHYHEFAETNKKHSDALSKYDDFAADAFCVYLVIAMLEKLSKKQSNLKK